MGSAKESHQGEFLKNKKQPAFLQCRAD